MGEIKIYDIQHFGQEMESQHDRNSNPDVEPMQLDLSKPKCIKPYFLRNGETFLRYPHIVLSRSY